jgi:hypothetical protein
MDECSSQATTTRRRRDRRGGVLRVSGMGLKKWESTVDAFTSARTGVRACCRSMLSDALRQSRPGCPLPSPRDATLRRCHATDDLSFEHMFSEWIARLFPEEFGRGQSYQHARVPGEPPRDFDYPSKPFEVGCKCVCDEHCNSGWMSDVEARMSDFAATPIVGIGCKLTADQQATLALWTAIKAVVVDEMMERQHRVIPEMHRQAIFAARSTGHLPPGVRRLGHAHWTRRRRNVLLAPSAERDRAADA